MDVQQKHGFRHEVGAPGQARMLARIKTGIAGFDRLCQRLRLPETDTHALAGDSVHGAGSIAGQRYMTAHN